MAERPTGRSVHSALRRTAGTPQVGRSAVAARGGPSPLALHGAVAVLPGLASAPEFGLRPGEVNFHPRTGLLDHEAPPALTQEGNPVANEIVLIGIGGENVDSLTHQESRALPGVA